MRKPFLLQNHRQRFAQAKKVMRRGGAAEVLVELGAERARLPPPVGRGKVGLAPRLQGAIVEVHKAEPRRHHHPLLARGDHHIDAPVIHAKLVAAERSDAVDREQGRVPRRVNGRAQRRNVVLDRA